jgi:ribosomal protein S18 acetylase RimI-like enzyme
MINFRLPNSNDVKSIAQLHAQSWQTNYRGSFKDEYLDGPVFDDRLAVWKERFTNPEPSQHIILAETNDMLCGFVCLFLDKDLEWGTLIDNIHVSGDFKGQGIGKILMSKANEYIRQHSKMDKYYLYVLKDNKSAITFYKRVGGIIQSSEILENPGGGSAEVCKIIWENK